METNYIPSILTKKESTIYQMVSQGFTTNEIATTLSISVKTVETHRSNCIKKLKLDGKKNALVRHIIENKYRG